ncbi:uncharacterized protein LY89DRAFT_688657 [Mollisia scopiformis]|uniref:Uncharacterized protein n=1 Tax=Mollisia scopiformis TaxID=149040 RepID=A0A194WW60_MOLSC|nr:uncharacterized protein LY89DRAFT_688657 [Mollisia scopiformis]KUJ12205.1 hypothetical protein LY89DRAFT_688657 [Mollisia scopiformis]
MPPTSTTNNGNAPKVRQAKKKAPPAPAPAPAPLPAPAPTSTPSSKAWDIPDIPDVTNVRGKYRGEAHYRGTPPAGVCDHQWKLAFKALKDRLRKSSGLSVETIHKLEMLGWIYQVCLVRLGVRPRDNCKCDECKK